MNRHDLFNAVGEISGDIIAEAGERHRARRVSPIKITAIAAALTIAFGITAFAAVMVVSRSSHSSNIPDYYDLPTAETLKNDVGIAPSFPEEFQNGYRFKSGHITYSEDANGETVESYKGIDCVYEKDGDEISVFADAAKAGVGMDDCETAEVYNGAEIKYIEYMNKLVPPDYEMTDRDKKDEESGAIVFSYGSPEVKISRMQSIGFEYGGLNYSISAADSPLTREDLVQTAKEIIDMQI